MNVAVWFFLRQAPADLRPVPRALIEDFCFGRRSIRPDTEGFVRCAEVVVRVERRRRATSFALGSSSTVLKQMD
jgi:hypothetical protein